MRPLRALVQAWQKLLAALCLRHGIHCFRCGDLTRAAALIQQSMLLREPDFRAHLFLGRIYLRLNRLDRAREEFARARTLDARKFVAHGGHDDLLLEMARRIQTWQAVPGRPAGRGARDDFSSAAERQRFRLLPPIQAEELEHIDWDDAACLFED